MLSCTILYDISVQLTLLSISLAIGSVYLKISDIAIAVHDECDAVFRSIFRFFGYWCCHPWCWCCCRLLYYVRCTFFRFNWKFICVPIRAGKQSGFCCDIGSNHRFFWFRLILFGFISFLFLVVLYSSSSILFFFFVQIRICSSDVNVVAVFVPFEIFGSPLIYILKGVLSETITFYLLFVCQI